jgi:hypothetical protein
MSWKVGRRGEGTTNAVQGVRPGTGKTAAPNPVRDGRKVREGRKTVAGPSRAGRSGLRRVDWVRLHVDRQDTQVSAEVLGVGSR